MQEDLRLLILIIGLVGVVFLVLDGFRKRFHKRKLENFDQRVFENTASQNNVKMQSDPLFSEVDSFDMDSSPTPKSAPASTPDKTTKKQKTTFKIKPFKSAKSEKNEKVVTKGPKSIKEEIIVLAIQSRTSGGFSGRSLEAILKSNHFMFGENQLFHRHVDNNPSQPILFSLANWAKTGSFDMETLKQERYKGLVMYMVITETAIHPLETFNKMLTASRQLAAALNGELCDTENNPITAKSIEHFKKRISDFAQMNLAQI